MGEPAPNLPPPAAVPASAVGIPASVHVWRVPLGTELSPEEALLAIRKQPWPFALVGRWAGGGAILGSCPLTLAGPDEDPLELLERLPTLQQRPAEGFVGGGWFGWIGYGTGHGIEGPPPQPPRPAAGPETHFAYYDHVLRLDFAGQWWFEALVTPGREAELTWRLAELSRLMAGPTPRSSEPPGSSTDVPGPFRPVAPGFAGHRVAVDRCREKIRSGELFQANLRLRLETIWNGDLPGLFARAAGTLNPAYGAAFFTPRGGLASMSPELFLQRAGNEVETAPIKGTVLRPDDPGRSKAALAALRHSAKDAAEHVMIIDVARNDLGRVCEFGTVEASPEPEAEAHPGVWHLVSRVRGRLRPGVGDAELIRATFPPCSVTGAPKIQAMRVISELEPLGREVFTGAIGFASPAAGLELNVAIRTFEAWDDRLWLDVGGGIVAGSSPESELEECLVKARPLIEAIGAEIDPGSPVPGTVGTGRKGQGLESLPSALGPGRDRPDPARGVLETIQVRDGVPHRLDRHVARLGRSLETLYRISVPPGLREQIVAIAAVERNGALRVVVASDGRIDLTPRPLAPRATPVALQPFTLPGGLGAHKWADRRLLDLLARPEMTPLLIDSDGSVLEAAWGNIWIREGERLLTPPADGRILPGVTRERVLEEGIWEGLHAREEPIPLDRLVEADGLLASSSLAGLIPAELTPPG